MNIHEKPYNTFGCVLCDVKCFALYFLLLFILFYFVCLCIWERVCVLCVSLRCMCDIIDFFFIVVLLCAVVVCILFVLFIRLNLMFFRLYFLCFFFYFGLFWLFEGDFRFDAFLVKYYELGAAFGVKFPDNFIFLSSWLERWKLVFDFGGRKKYCFLFFLRLFFL